MRGGRAPTPLPDIREEERSRQISPTTSPVATPTRNEASPPQRSSIFSIFSFGGSSTGSNLFPLSRICSASGRANPVTGTTSSSTSSRSRRSRSNRRSSSQAPPIPKKRPIKPVKIAAPCDHSMVVDQSPACVYPNPPSYNDSHKDQTISILSVETNETGQSVSSDRERHHSTDLISFRGAVQPCGSDSIGPFGSEGGESTSMSSTSTAKISPSCSWWKKWGFFVFRRAIMCFRRYSVYILRVCWLTVVSSIFKAFSTSKWTFWNDSFVLFVCIIFSSLLCF